MSRGCTAAKARGPAHGIQDKMPCSEGSRRPFVQPRAGTVQRSIGLGRLWVSLGEMRSAIRWLGLASTILGMAYLLAAYAVAPAIVRRSVRRHPGLAGTPSVTRTALGLAGDPLNIALVATESRLVSTMVLGGWDPADPLSFSSGVRIAASTLRHKPYWDAPVSTLLLNGCKQDIAFEQEVGHDARKRHHVRFWHSLPGDEQGRWLWIGAATFDSSVGLSHETGQVTHHISRDIDAERNKLVGDLQSVGAVEDLYFVSDFQETRVGRNGGGDPYETDGRLAVVVLRLE